MRANRAILLGSVVIGIAMGVSGLAWAADGEEIGGAGLREQVIGEMLRDDPTLTQEQAEEFADLAAADFGRATSESEGAAGERAGIITQGPPANPGEKAGIIIQGPPTNPGAPGGEAGIIVAGGGNVPNPGGEAGIITQGPPANPGEKAGIIVQGPPANPGEKAGIIVQGPGSRGDEAGIIVVGGGNLPDPKGETGIIIQGPPGRGDETGIIVQGGGNLPDPKGETGIVVAGPERGIPPGGLEEMEKVQARGDQLREQLGGDERKVFEQLQQEFPEHFHEMKEGDIEDLIKEGEKEWGPHGGKEQLEQHDRFGDSEGERFGEQMERFREEMERDREGMERHREEMERGRDESQREIESTERPTMERPTTDFERPPHEVQYEGGH